MQKWNATASAVSSRSIRIGIRSLIAVVAFGSAGIAQDLETVGSLWRKAYGDFDNIPAKWYCQGNAATVAKDSDIVVTGWRDTAEKLSHTHCNWLVKHNMKGPAL